MSASDTTLPPAPSKGQQIQKGRKKRPSLLMSLLRILFLLAVVFIIAMALLIGLGRTYLDTHPEIKQEMTARISDRLGLPLKSENISVRWRWSGPQISISQLEFMYPDNKRSLLKFDDAQFILDIRQFIKTRILSVASVQLYGCELVLERDKNNEIRLNQYKISELEQILKNTKNNQFENPPEANVKLPNGIFNFQDIDLVYKDHLTDQEIRVEKINVLIDKNDQLLKLDVRADSRQLANNLKISASTPNPDLHNEFEWQVLFEGEAMQLPEITRQWQSLRPLFITNIKPGMQAVSKPLVFAAGEGDIRLWFRVADDNLRAMNGTINLDALKFSRDTDELNSHIRDLDFRFSYENGHEFTHIKADRIVVNGQENNWPQDNGLQLKLVKFVDGTYQRNKSSINREVPGFSDIENKVTDPANLTSDSPSIIDAAIPGVTDAPELSENEDTNGLVKQAELTSTYLRLEDIASVLEVFVQQLPDHSMIPAINWSQLQGVINNLTANVSRKNQSKNSGLDLIQANALFSNLAIPSINDGASFKGLDGALNFSEDKGTLVLSSEKFVYTNPNVFRNALDLDKLKTKLNITKEQDAWRLVSDSIELINRDMTINTDLDLFFQKDKSPVLVLNAVANPISLDNINHYYPANIMKPGLVNWLDSYLSGGEVAEAKITFNGALADYPFRNGQGEFLVEFDVKDLNVQFAKDWPLAVLQEAHLVIKNQSFDINAKKVKTGELRSFPVKARFPDLATGNLELDIETPLDMQKARTWINSTPLKNNVGRYIEHVQVSGDAATRISLKLPINAIDQLTLQGQIEFSDNPLSITVLKQPLSNLVGKLDFTKSTISSDSLQAVYAGQLLKTDIATEQNDIFITLHTDAEFGSLVAKRYAKYIAGKSNLDAVIRIGGNGEDKDGGIKDIKVRSNLLGTGLKLPAPFAKTSDSILPLDLTINVISKTSENSVDNLHISGKIGNTNIRSRMYAAKTGADMLPSDQEWLLHSITLVGGNNEKLFTTINPDLSRVHLLGEYSHVDFDEWLEFFNQDSDAEINEAFEVGVIDVRLEKLDAIGQSFSNMNVVLIPSASTWKANLSNENVDGTITFPRPWSETGLIQADLKKYHLLIPEKSSETIEFDPREIPNVSVRIEDFKIADMPMGEANIRIKRESNGANLETFTVSNPTFSIDGNGGWYITTEGETSLVTLDLKSSDLAKTLVQLGYAPSAGARSAEIFIELNWPGSPFVDILKELSGSISFKLLDGELQDVDPGAGRFLALLSIAQLPKRLSLDFRDVFNAGLGYDELSADFLIENGQAYTNNMLMRGPVADLGVIGRVGLATRDFDQAAVVQADLGSSLPIAGVLAGGLGVGAAMLLFSEIFKNPLKQATQVFYKIDGEWNDPQIIRTPPDQLREVPIAPR